MWWIRFFMLLLLPILTGSALLLTGAIAQQTPQAPSSAPTAPATRPAQTPAKTPPAPKPDENAAKTVDQAVDQLDPRKLGWVEAGLWQRVKTPGLTYQADGRYAAGPGNRLRVDLKVRFGGTEGESLQVCDGATVWNSVRVGTDRAVKKWSLQRIDALLSSPGTMPQLKEEFYRSESFTGLQPLVQNLRKQMVFTKRETARWKDHETWKLTGTWSADVAKALTPPAGGWGPFVPRTCVLYLDQKSFWPYRVEWWGPKDYGTDDELLVEMEFRNPERTPASSPIPARLAAAFLFDAKGTAVQDVTQEKQEQHVRARNMPAPGQGAAPRPSPGPSRP